MIADAFILDGKYCSEVVSAFEQFAMKEGLIPKKPKSIQDLDDEKAIQKPGPAPAA